MKFASPLLSKIVAASLFFWSASAGFAQTAEAPATENYRPWLPPSLASSPALRAFTHAPFANSDVKPGETLIFGAFVVSTGPQNITLKIVSSTAANGESKTFETPQGKQIQLGADTELWAAAKKRQAIDWTTQVVDYASVFVVGTEGNAEGGAGQPFRARRIDVVDGYVGDLLEDPRFQAQIQQMREEEAAQQALVEGELPPHAMWLENVGIELMTSGYGEPQIAKSIDRNALTLGGESYSHGIGTHADSDLLVDLKGKATRFMAVVGVDDEMTSRGSVVFSVWADGRKIAGSSIMRVGDEPELISADLTGAKTLRLQVSDAGDSANSDHADWAGAMLELTPATDATNPTSRPSSISYATDNLGAPLDQNMVFATEAPPDVLWLESLDLRKMSSGFNAPQSAKSIDGNPLRLAARTYPHGVGTHADSRFAIDLKGAATRFIAVVGIDDEIATNGSVEFSVWVDGQEMANSGVIKAGQAPQLLSVNLRGASRLELRASDGDDGKNSDHADWGGALIQLVPGTEPDEAPVATDLPDDDEE